MALRHEGPARRLPASIWPLFLGFAGLALLGPLLAAGWFFEARGMGRKAGS